jgi:hypothetical protein
VLVSPAVDRRNAERARVLARLPILTELARKRPAAHDRIACLVGCGKSKGDAPAPARTMYTSPLFRKSLELAELLGDRAFVTSARHGLVELDEVISPYDSTLNGASRFVRASWGHEIVDALEARALGSASCLLVVTLMGAAYSDPIVEEIERRRANGSPRFARPTVLMSGLEVGERLAFLNRALVIARGAK